jgi:hypothetical protein
MNTIGAGISIHQVTPSYSPLGKPAVGLESPDTKDQTLPPVEESANAEKARNQRSGKKVDEVSADSKRNNGKQPDTEPNDSEHDGLVPAKPSTQDMQAAAAASQLSAEAQLQIAAERAAALTISSSVKPTDSATVADAFKQAAGNNNAPGSLLDQQI